MAKKKEITNADILERLDKQGRALERQGDILEKQGTALETHGQILTNLSVNVASMQVDMKELATKDNLTNTKSEILNSVDKVMHELQAHRQEDKSTFQLYVELRNRQDRRDKAFAQALKLNLRQIDDEG